MPREGNNLIGDGVTYINWFSESQTLRRLYINRKATKEFLSKSLMAKAIEEVHMDKHKLHGR